MTKRDIIVGQARAKSGALRSLHGRFSVTGDKGASTTTLERDARAVIRRLRHHLKTDGKPIGLELISHRHTPSGHYLRFRQVVTVATHFPSGTPILGSQITLLIRSGKARVLRIARFQDRDTQRLHPDARAQRWLTEAQAVKGAQRHLGNPRERLPAKARPRYLPSERGLKPVWAVSVLTGGPPHDWRCAIDAISGDLLHQVDRLRHAQGSGLVFDPSPIVTARDLALDPSSDPAHINSFRVERPLQGLSFDGTEYRLAGPYCQIIGPTEQPSGDFHFDRAHPAFEATNVYHHVDRFNRFIRDGLQIPGVLEAPITCDVHSSEIEGSAMYSDEAFMLYFGDATHGQPDTAEDAELILHEYMHAVQHNICPNWGAPNTDSGRDEAAAMGEGAADVAPCIYFHEATQGFQPEVFADWISPPNGKRRVDGVKRYPGEGSVGPQGDWAEHSDHGNGEIWSAALWRAYLLTGGALEDTTARRRAAKAILRCLVDHYHLLTGDETFSEAAMALALSSQAMGAAPGMGVAPILQAMHERHILRCTAASVALSPCGPSEGGVWMRQSDDGERTHQHPRKGVDNTLCAELTNTSDTIVRCCAALFHLGRAAPSQLAAFSAPGAAALAFDLAPGESRIVTTPLPPGLAPRAGRHGVLSAAVFVPEDGLPPDHTLPLVSRPMEMLS